MLSAVQWPLDSPVLAQLYLALLTYILMDQVSHRLIDYVPFLS